jgi:hypothetical protein
MEYGGSKTFKWTKSCHMYADNAKELHEMAESIGLKRHWYQDHERLKHYDLVPSKRVLAVRAGAVEHTVKEMVEFMRRCK